MVNVYSKLVLGVAAAAALVQAAPVTEVRRAQAVADEVSATHRQLPAKEPGLPPLLENDGTLTWSASPWNIEEYRNMYTMAEGDMVNVTLELPTNC